VTITSGVLLQGRGLRDGRSIIIIAWTNAVATMLAMIAGHLVLLEALPFNPIHLLLRAVATCLILAGIAASALRLEPPAVLLDAVHAAPCTTPPPTPSPNVFTRVRRRCLPGRGFPPCWLH
jgi:hypothetical protein